MQFKVDPIALMTALGILLGAGTGGKLDGVGFQVGAEYVPGEGLRRIGFDPKLLMTAQLPGYGMGVTLGTTSLVDKDLARDAAAGIRVPPPYDPGPLFRLLKQYEMEHQYGYNHFGVEYPLRAFADPARYDPGVALLFGTPVRSYFTREEPLTGLPRKHYNFSIEARTGDLLSELTKLFRPGQ